jgi:pyruvate/2-oxoglutarate dehydrogenase complex dihydrolipoamide acyltransferase (E2) component
MSKSQDERPPAAPTLEVRVPDLGSFADVAIIELLVQVGDQVEKDTPLMTLESDKATIDIPSPAAGQVARIAVKPGDKVNSGDMFMELAGARQEVAEEESPEEESAPVQVAQPASPKPAQRV